jgi:phosphate transport system ATP-binding protein
MTEIAWPLVGTQLAAARAARAQESAVSVAHETKAEAPKTEVKFAIRDVKAWFGDKEVLHGFDMNIRARRVTALIGPSGCGKSTFLRCLNRMHEMVTIARFGGTILLDGQDIYAKDVDPVILRRRVGMVFQKPNPFPTMSIRDNVLAGLRLTGRLNRADADGIVEKALKQAALWKEVADRLKDPATGLSGGQQQRLCIARALAVDPSVLLMDEPCSALDPVATAHIEDLIADLREHYTIVIVTHNMQQAARVSDRTAFLLSGDLIEYGDTNRIFTAPKDSRTEDYITGKFG